MASKKELRSRWNTPAGEVASRAVENGLRAGASADELRRHVANLPRADEVSPALDLRGIRLPALVAVRKTDLSGARFDAAALGWNFGGSALRGAVFDGAEGANVDFGGCDLAGSSFVNARLPGAIFYGADLRDADLSGVRMNAGQLKGADCRGAKFAGADLRTVWAAGADLREADLRRANLVGASLGGARWDEATRFDGARLSPEGAPAELCRYAEAQGATTESEQPQWQLGLLDATRKVLEGENHDGALTPVIERLAELRPQVERDPQTPWANVLRDELSGARWRVVQAAVRTAASNMGALLD